MDNRIDSTLRNTFPSIAHKLNKKDFQELFSDYDNALKRNEDPTKTLLRNNKYEDAFQSIEKTQEEAIKGFREKSQKAVKNQGTPVEKRVRALKESRSLQASLSRINNLSGISKNVRNMSSSERATRLASKKEELIRNTKGSLLKEGVLKKEDYADKTYDQPQRSSRIIQAEKALENRIKRNEEATRNHLGITPPKDSKHSDRVLNHGKYQKQVSREDHIGKNNDSHTQAFKDEVYKPPRKKLSESVGRSARNLGSRMNPLSSVSSLKQNTLNGLKKLPRKLSNSLSRAKRGLSRIPARVSNDFANAAGSKMSKTPIAKLSAGLGLGARYLAEGVWESTKAVGRTLGGGAGLIKSGANILGEGIMKVGNSTGDMVTSALNRKTEKVSFNLLKEKGGTLSTPSDYQFSERANYNGQVHFVGPEPQKPFLERLKSGPLGESYRNLVNKAAMMQPNNVHDVLTATFHGVQVEGTFVGKFGGILGGAESVGINPLTGEKMNLNYLSNMSEKEVEHWKQMHIDETSKSLRHRGSNIDPFNTNINNKLTKADVVEAKETLKRLAEKDLTGLSEGAVKNIKTTQEKASKVISDYSESKEFRQTRKAEDLKQLREVEAKINNIEPLYKKGSENSIKNLPSRYRMNKQYKKDLKSQAAELKERIKRNDMNFHTSDFRHEPLKLAEHGVPLKAGFEQTKDIHPKIYSHTKGFIPTYGTSGYGLGFYNSLHASRAEHFTRAMHYLGPLGVFSGMTALKESFGIMHKNQARLAQQAVGLGKIPHLLVPGLALGTILSSMSDGAGAGEIAGDLFAMGTMIHGWRAGTALGASPFREASLGRLIGTGVGGITGAATGLIAGTAVANFIGDIHSNDSSVRKTVKKMASKEMFAHSNDSQKSLTARQASLQKLAKSGLNDRGLLLGNEASVLKGAM